MAPQIKLTVTQNEKIINSVTKAMTKQHLIQSLEEFQLEANAALTKMIEELGEIDEAIGDADLEDDEATDEDADESKKHTESTKKKKMRLN